MQLYPGQIAVKQLAVDLVEAGDGFACHIQIIQETAESAHPHLLIAFQCYAHNLVALAPDCVAQVSGQVIAPVLAVGVEVEGNLAVVWAVDGESPSGRHINDTVAIKR